MVKGGMNQVLTLAAAATPADIDKLTHLRRGLIAHGYRPVACIGKAAVVDNWQNSRWSAAQMEGIARNYPGATNTGLLCGELVGLDIDTPDEETARAIRAMVLELPDGDRSPYRIGKAPKFLYIFRAAEPRDKITTGAYLVGGLKCQIEVFGNRTQFVGFGLHPDTRQPYEWHNGSPAETPLADLPEITPESIDGLLARAEGYFAERGTLMKSASKPRDGRASTVVDSDHPWSIINSRALANLDAWATQLGLEDQEKYQSGHHSIASFRPSMNAKVRKRGRSLNIQPNGIVDYSDNNRGYSPIDLVAACLDMSPTDAAEWLRDRVGGGDATPSISVSGLLAQPARRAACGYTGRL
jgi:hypothetical protein